MAAGQPLFTIGGPDDTRFARALESLEGEWEIGDDAPVRESIVWEHIKAGG